MEQSHRGNSQLKFPLLGVTFRKQRLAFVFRLWTRCFGQIQKHPKDLLLRLFPSKSTAAFFLYLSPSCIWNYFGTRYERGVVCCCHLFVFWGSSCCCLWVSSYTNTIYASLATGYRNVLEHNTHTHKHKCTHVVGADLAIRTKTKVDLLNAIVHYWL